MRRQLDGDWARLADHVIERRNALGMTQEDVRAAGGPSTATLRLIEGALQDSYRPAIIGRLERALRWAPGSAKQILEGGEPILLDNGRTSAGELRPDDDNPYTDPEDRRIWETTRGLPTAERHFFVDQHRVFRRYASDHDSATARENAKHDRGG